MTEREPLLTVGGITAIVSAFLVFLRSFGVDITEEQQDAIRSLVAVLAPIILAIIGRQLVFAPNTVEREKAESYRDGLNDATPPEPTRAQPPRPKMRTQVPKGEGIQRMTNVGK